MRQWECTRVERCGTTSHPLRIKQDHRLDYLVLTCLATWALNHFTNLHQNTDTDRLTNTYYDTDTAQPVEHCTIRYPLLFTPVDTLHYFFHTGRRVTRTNFTSTRLPDRYMVSHSRPATTCQNSFFDHAFVH